jgi:uncharacterized membrane protein
VNLALLDGVLLAGAIALELRISPPRDRKAPQLDRDVQTAVYAALLLVPFAALTFESWRAVDYLANHGPVINDPAMAKQMATSVLWSIIGFASVLIGFWKRIRPLRIAALVLLGITLAKIFLVDMKDVQAVWRILSFIALGSLLLGVSYIYSRQLARRG